MKRQQRAGSPRLRGARGRRKRAEGSARADIVHAAGALFLRKGLGEVTLRGIAREARVDPALVLYYFSSKEDLALEALGATIRPLMESVFQAGPPRRGTGAAAVLRFLRFWDAQSQGTAFAGLFHPASAEGRLGAAVRKFVASQIESQFAKQWEGEELRTRVGLFMTQIIGLGAVRYLFRIEPIASSPPEVLAEAIGPNLDRYLVGSAPL